MELGRDSVLDLPIRLVKSTEAVASSRIMIFLSLASARAQGTPENADR